MSDDPFDALDALLALAHNERCSDELLGNAFRARIAQLEEIGESKLVPGIDTPSPLQMARWLDERAEVNLKYAHLPPKAWEARTLPYIGVRLRQAANIIRDLHIARAVELRLGAALLNFITAVDDNSHPSADHVEHMIAQLLKDVSPLLRQAIPS